MESERALLGTFLNDENLFKLVSTVVSDRDFYQQAHRLIYGKIMYLIEGNVPLNVNSLSQELKRVEQLEEVGGQSYVESLASLQKADLDEVVSQAKYIRELSLKRSLGEALCELVQSTYSKNSKSVDDLIGEIETALSQFQRAKKRAWCGFNEPCASLAKAINLIDQAYKSRNTEESAAKESRIFDWGEFFEGLKPGAIALVAGRAGVGKTAFSLNLVEEVCLNRGLPVALISSREDSAQIFMRLLCSAGRLDHSKIQSGQLDDEDWKTITAMTGRLANTPFMVWEDSQMSSSSLRYQVRHLHRASERDKLGLIIIDALNLPECTNGAPGFSPATMLLQAAKSLSREWGVPIVVLVRLNGDPGARQGFPPVARDLGELGVLSDEAESILLMYRDVSYDQGLTSQNEMHLVVAKSRDEPQRTIRFKYDDRCIRFESVALG